MAAAVVMGSLKMRIQSLKTRLLVMRTLVLASRVGGVGSGQKTHSGVEVVASDGDFGQLAGANCVRFQNVAGLALQRRILGLEMVHGHEPASRIQDRHRPEHAAGRGSPAPTSTISAGRPKRPKSRTLTKQ